MPVFRSTALTLLAGAAGLLVAGCDPGEPTDSEAAAGLVLASICVRTGEGAHCEFADGHSGIGIVARRQPARQRPAGVRARVRESIDVGPVPAPSRIGASRSVRVRIGALSVVGAGSGNRIDIRLGTVD